MSGAKYFTRTKFTFYFQKAQLKLSEGSHFVQYLTLPTALANARADALQIDTSFAGIRNHILFQDAKVLSLL